MKIPGPTPAAQAGYLGPYIGLLPPNARLLVQAGGGDGALALAYKRIYPAAHYRCLEADAERASQARAWADAAIQVDLDTAGEALYQHLRWADAWIFDTTLENLQAPRQVLAQIRKVIDPDACIVARVVNRAHWTQPASPPLHNYSLEQLMALLQLAGFRVGNGAELHYGPPPPDVALALRQQALHQGLDPEQAVSQATPSHFLVKAFSAS